jgi:ATP-binding cassette subfamily B protein
MQNPLPSKLWPFVWHFLKPYKAMVAVFVLLGLMAGCWGPFNSMLMKKMINILSATGGADIALLTTPAILLVLNFIVFDNITWRSIALVNYKYQPLIKNSITRETFNYVLGASPQFFHDNLSGRLASKISTLADNIERILHNISPNFFRGASLIFIALVTMYSVNITFFWILFVWAMAFTVFSLSMSSRLVVLSDIHADAESAVSGQVVDSISNASNIKIFARRDDEITRLDGYLKSTKEKFRSNEIFIILLHSGQGAIIAVMLAFMLYTLIQLFSSHVITVGDFSLIMGLSFEVAYLTWWTMSQVDEFNQAVGKCKQSLDTLIVPQGILDKKDAIDLTVTKGEITFNNVMFQYKDTAPLFQNKSISIQPGQKVGLVGYSGGGKSTFVNLILRLYDVTDGSIQIDGQDIRDVTQDSLRRAIAMIPQDPTLFHRSLMDNIRYGKMEASDTEVIEAAKKAHADVFISKLSLGYESPVGERGVKLSGGQRQRIAIARAILKNAPILILDEATSQLDSVTESDIQDSLWELMQGKTTIVVAHRLSTLLHMDRIMVFDHGKIAEDGTHEALLAMNGLYKTLWDAQVGGFIPDAPQIT